MECLKCKKEHDGSFGSGRYCSRSCANARVRTEKVKENIAKGMRTSEKWLLQDYSHNRNPDKIKKLKETRKAQRNYETAHAWSIKKWLKEDRGYRCENCNLAEWMGQPIKLEVDHIDGNKYNNDLSNLKVLCPNCHSLTPTWRRKKTVS